MQAFQILMDWPNPTDGARDLALKVCRAALKGKIDAQAARAVFVAFAEIHDLIAPDINSLMARRSNRTSNPHVR
jgi:hypothetical protein